MKILFIKNHDKTVLLNPASLEAVEMFRDGRWVKVLAYLRNGEQIRIGSYHDDREAMDLVKSIHAQMEGA